MAPDQEVAAAKAAVSDAQNQPWDRLQLRYVSLADVSSLRFEREAGGITEKVYPFSCAMDLDDLRAAMADEHGTWFSCTLDVRGDGSYASEYNYDERPSFGNMEIVDEVFLADLQRFPRPWEEIPEWHPAKQKYTEETWAAETQKF